MDILWVVKCLLGLSDASQDNILQIIIESTTEKVLSYCKLSTLPSGLEKTVAEMAVKAYKKMSEGEVSSVKRGDVTVNFSVKAVSDVFKGYTRILNVYRRARPTWKEE
ncbi:MAG: Phage gp6-like head-tail connector protein [Firmicutes bacterium ADurb.Bin193]|nr:MAG: Phage gp6-like head-tail connector protein [Firmicutes bacterium ADurb.Bin193]